MSYDSLFKSYTGNLTVLHILQSCDTNLPYFLMFAELYKYSMLHLPLLHKACPQAVASSAVSVQWYVMSLGGNVVLILEKLQLPNIQFKYYLLVSLSSSVQYA